MHRRAHNWTSLWSGYDGTTNFKIEWIRGKVIKVQNSFFSCLYDFWKVCDFGKVKYIGNNILKYLSHSLKITRLINLHKYIFSLSKLILFFNGRVNQVHRFIWGHFDLDPFTSEICGKWQLKCNKTPLILISLFYANLNKLQHLTSYMLLVIGVTKLN